MKLTVLSTFLLALCPPGPPQGAPGQEKPKDLCASRIITTIPVAAIQACAITPTDALIVSTGQAIFTSPEMLYLSADQKTLALGFICGGEGGWLNLPAFNGPLVLPPGTYELEYFDKFDRKIRVVVPCNGLTEEICAKLFQARVTMAEKMFPPKAM